MQEINGFKILQDFGSKVIAICKSCAREWEVAKYSLYKNLGCGCIRRKQFKELPDVINGFKIIKDLGNEDNKRRAIVECRACKKEYITNPWQLVNRKNCGCYRRGAKASKYKKTHKRLVQIFLAMKNRCSNEKASDYKYYGAKGIKVCDEWVNDTDSFCEWSFANGYTEDLTIDRIDNTKGYNPENCRWSTRKTQGRNKGGVKLTMNDAMKIREDFKNNPNFNWISEAFKYNVSPSTIDSVLRNYCWKED